MRAAPSCTMRIDADLSVEEQQRTYDIESVVRPYEGQAWGQRASRSEEGQSGRSRAPPLRSSATAYRRSDMLRSVARAVRPRVGPASRPAPRRTLFWGATPGAAASAATAGAAAGSELTATHVPSVAGDLLPLVLGVVLAHAAIDDEGDDDRLTQPPWKVESFGDKGSGAVAARDIARGERLIAERPLCIWPNNLSEDEARRLFEAMTPTEQSLFMDLARTEGTGSVKALDEIRARRATNGFSIPLLDASGKSQGAAGMVFPKIAR